MNWLIKLLSCFCVWQIQPVAENDYDQFHAIIALGFGLPYDGKSNIAIAQISQSLIEKYQLPLIAQWEIADILSDNLYNAGVIRQHRIKGKYLDTNEVLAQAQQICQFNYWHKVVLISHPHHLWRAKMTAEKLGLNVAVAYTNEVTYDPESEQSWTKSAWRFIPREIAGRLLFLFKGYI